MAGLTVFPTLEAAIRAGWQMYDRRADGTYLVRKKTDAGYALAIVDRHAR